MVAYEPDSPAKTAPRSTNTGDGIRKINTIRIEPAPSITSWWARWNRWGVSVRGLGKIKLYAVNGRTKKDRISVVIHRYV